MAVRFRAGCAATWDISTEAVLEPAPGEDRPGRRTPPERAAGRVGCLITDTAAPVTTQALNVCGGLGNYRPRGVHTPCPAGSTSAAVMSGSGSAALPLRVWNAGVPATSSVPSHSRPADSPSGTREMTGPKKATEGRSGSAGSLTAITGVPGRGPSSVTACACEARSSPS